MALGGALGSLARFVVASLALGWSGGFPWGTLAVNFAGSLALGYLMHALPAAGASSELRAFLTVGFCGGFTTFSTFGYETALLLQSGVPVVAAVYVTASLVLSVAGVFAGLALAG